MCTKFSTWIFRTEKTSALKYVPDVSGIVLTFFLEQYLLSPHKERNNLFREVLKVERIYISRLSLMVKVSELVGLYFCEINGPRVYKYYRGICIRLEMPANPD